MKGSNFTNEDIFNKIVICSVLTAQDVINLLDCRAILVEYGGYLSHASIWSREYHKPCLVNCKNITKLLKTGDIIQINGETGRIELKQKNDSIVVLFFTWWFQVESNHRHKDFQSFALPTEL